MATAKQTGSNQRTAGRVLRAGTSLGKASTPTAIPFAALASVTNVKLSSNNVEFSKQLYLSLWFHPTCGGRPEAYIGRNITCDTCAYSLESGGNEPLGQALQRSDFQAKIHHPAWFV